MSIRLSRAAITTVAALALSASSLAACSSSGGGSAPSQSQLAAKVKQDPEVKPYISKLSSSKQDSVANCIASAMQSGLTTQEQSDFANGKTDLKGIKDNSAKAKAASASALKCLTDAGVSP